MAGSQIHTGLLISLWLFITESCPQSCQASRSQTGAECSAEEGEVTPPQFYDILSAGGVGRGPSSLAGHLALALHPIIMYPRLHYKNRFSSFYG